jgi:predicted nucleotidyltransferase
MKNYYTYLSRREKEYQQLNKEYHQQVRKKLHKSINEIISKFPTVKKIIVFGSYLTDRFNKKSDLDLYIEEITGEEFYIIKNLLEDSLELDVDIYTQTDSQRFIDKVKERGEILYERQTKNPGS